jgi:hypothetical protein
MPIVASLALALALALALTTSRYRAISSAEKLLCIHLS